MCTKFEVSINLRCRENRSHATDGQTDERGATLNAASYEGPHNSPTCYNG